MHLNSGCAIEVEGGPASVVDLLGPHRSPWCSRSSRSPQWSTGSISGQVVPSGGTGTLRNPHRRPELFEVDADGGGVVDVYPARWPILSAEWLRGLKVVYAPPTPRQRITSDSSASTYRPSASNRGVIGLFGSATASVTGHQDAMGSCSWHPQVAHSLCRLARRCVFRCGQRSR